MKIGIFNNSNQSIGGGWSFIRNFVLGVSKLSNIGAEVVHPTQADIILIPSASMARRDELQALNDGRRKFVLRVDNILRNSRNRNTGMSRMKWFAENVDEVIYQSEWARGLLSGFLGCQGKVIYNGVDTDVFKPEGDKADFGNVGDKIYLYSRFNRDESKNWIKVWFEYQYIHRTVPRAALVIVGNFSPELREYNFDFFRGERIHFIGPVSQPERMAEILRATDVLLAPYEYDCYSNTIQEALACKTEVDTLGVTSGGLLELLKNGPIPKEEMVREYVEVFSELLS